MQSEKVGKLLLSCAGDGRGLFLSPIRLLVIGLHLVKYLSNNFAYYSEH